MTAERHLKAVEGAARTRKRTRNDEVWDACIVALGYGPLTDTEKRLWGKYVGSLARAGADSEKILSVAEWYHRHWPDIDLTITSLEKWYSHFLQMAEKKSKAKMVQAKFCDFCGRRDGTHADDCRRDAYTEG